MVNEEQQQEIEVLQSIYPDELTIISDEEFRIRIELESPKGTPAEELENGSPTLILTVKYPPNYPDLAPNIDLSVDPSLPRLSLDFPADKTAILSALDSVIEENLGMAMVFTLVTTIKEAAEKFLQDRLDALEAVKEEEARLEEEKEMAKFKGTPVTRETFMAWRAKFRADMEELKRQREKEKEEEEKGKRGSGGGALAAAEAMKKRLTGRQLYLAGMVGNEDDAEVEGDDNSVDLAKLKLQDGGK